LLISNHDKKTLRKIGQEPIKTVYSAQKHIYVNVTNNYDIFIPRYNIICYMDNLTKVYLNTAVMCVLYNLTQTHHFNFISFKHK